MNRRFARQMLAAAIGITGGFLASGDLIAQDPTPTPTPAPLPLPTKPPVPQPTAKQPRPEPTVLDPQALNRADLKITMSPFSLSAVPSVFTVQNDGSAATTTASLLRVTVRLLPLEGELGGAQQLPAGVLDGVGNISGVLGGVRTSPDVRPREATGGSTDSEFAELCAPPFEDFQAAIDPLDPGESQPVSQSGTRVRPEIRSVGLVATRPATRVPTHSYVREIQVRLVCVYELRAVADANAEVSELNERNNEVVHIFQREVTLR